MTARVEPHNIAAEQALLGAILIDNRVWASVAPLLRSEQFYDPLHAQIFEVAGREIVAGRTATPITLKPMFAQHPAVGPELTVTQYLGDLAARAVTTREAPSYAQSIVECAARREMAAVGERLIEASANPLADLRLAGAAAIGDLDTVLATGRSELATRTTVADAGEQLLDDMLNDDGCADVRTGLAAIDGVMSGWRRKMMVVLAGRPSMGKLQPVDSKVLLADGTWRDMGDLSIGDELASWDGRPSKVTGIFPHGIKQAYRITLADGRCTEAGADHLWRVMYREWDEPRILTTADLIGLLRRKRYQKRLFIDLVTGDFGFDVGLPIDAYVLGSLIANGGFSSGDGVRLTTPHQAVVDRVDTAVTADGLKLKPGARYQWQLSRSGGRGGNAAMNALREVGLMGCKAESKFIPPAYLSASKSTRTALLQGLMDGDGWVEKCGAMRYGTSSRRLAEDVQTLVRSLGGLATISPRAPKYTYKGEKLDGLPSWVVNMSFADGKPFVSVPAKLERVDRRRVSRLTIGAIEPSRVVETQCISVSHPDRLYVTDDYIVTHNSAVATSIARQAAARGTGVLFFTLEMTAREVSARMITDAIWQPEAPIAYAAAINRRLPNDRRAHERFARGVLAQKELPLVIEEGSGKTISEMLSQVRREVEDMRRAGRNLGLVVVDYLGLVKASARYSGNKVHEIGEISAGLKAMAKDCDVCVLALSQLNRGVEGRDSKRPGLADLRDSGAIEQDADAVIFVYREAYYLRTPQDDPSRESDRLARLDQCRNTVELIVAKNRNGATDTIPMFMDMAANALRDATFVREPAHSYTDRIVGDRE